ncbi:Phospholipase D family member 3 [Fasciola hepatica]|uniref:Phospholipase D family member 3 n=1 Tax=Fasciola hepatica TaxID=6192 RepID=A0A4E0RD79_FASHE|nr:Phospholipase D family member 3 [Fasciola hepatica]
MAYSDEFLCISLSLFMILGPCSASFYRPVTNAQVESTLPWTRDEMDRLSHGSQCQVLLVESMPQNLTYSTGAPRHASTYFAWNLLLSQATRSISIASFYWSLLAEPVFNETAAEEGRLIYEQLLDKSKNLNVTVAQSGPARNDTELEQLEAAGANIYWVNVAKILGRGILHTKLWTVDRKHAYLGSANMDWRSLTQVKELGVLFLNCPMFVEDLNKIHTACCLAADKVPQKWPNEVITRYNRSHPMHASVNGFPSHVYFTASPTEFNPPGRSYDLDAILAVINKAEEYVYISVMDYSAEVVNYELNSRGEFWPTIDNALREAAITRGIEIRLLISRWRYTSSSMISYLMSLRQLNGVRGARIRVRFFVVPSFTTQQRMIPHARVNHNKYMVTDKTAYIGTSNWSGDYFLYTGGAAFVVEEDKTVLTTPQESQVAGKSIHDQLVDIFYRDWNSEYSFEP